MLIVWAKAGAAIGGKVASARAQAMLNNKPALQRAARLLPLRGDTGRGTLTVSLPLCSEQLNKSQCRKFPRGLAQRYGMTQFKATRTGIIATDFSINLGQRICPDFLDSSAETFGRKREMAEESTGCRAKSRRVQEITEAEDKAA